MKFNLIDAILEQSAERIVAMKQVTAAEEYLADHFPSFPILPGVMMLEAMVQAARAMLPSSPRLVLGEVKALKYGQMVRPGDALIVEVTLHSRLEGGAFSCKGVGNVRRAAGSSKGLDEQTAVSGRFVMRPMNP